MSLSDDLAKLVLPLVVGSGSTLAVIYQFRKDKRDAASSIASIAAGQLNTLSTQLMGERADRERAIERLQSEIDRMRDEGREREERLRVAERDLQQFWIYAGELEGMLRDRGLEPPTRPHGLYVLGGRK